MIGPRTFTFLGTGTSIGVPVIGCSCAVCTSSNPRNSRYRSSVLIGTPKGNLLIDTGPEMRLQLLREKVKLVHAVVYTHYHADHLFGLDDLRIIAHHLNAPVPIYCTDDVEEVIRRAFSYVFLSPKELPMGSIPKLEFMRIDERPFEVLGQTVTPIPLQHNWYRVFGYRIADVAYCTDVSEIPESSWPLLEGVRIFIIDALRYRKHPAHFGLDEALAAIERVAPEKAYLTHMSHEFGYDELQPKLPAGVEMAYDGLSFIF